MRARVCTRREYTATTRKHRIILLYCLRRRDVGRERATMGRRGSEKEPGVNKPWRNARGGPAGRGGRGNGTAESLRRRVMRRCRHRSRSRRRRSAVKDNGGAEEV